MNGRLTGRSGGVDRDRRERRLECDSDSKLTGSEWEVDAVSGAEMGQQSINLDLWL